MRASRNLFLTRAPQHEQHLALKGLVQLFLLLENLGSAGAVAFAEGKGRGEGGFECMAALLAMEVFQACCSRSNSQKEGGWERKADGLAHALQKYTRQHISSVLPVRAQSTNSESHKSGGTSPSSSRGVECPDKAVFSTGTLVHSAAGIMKAGLISLSLCERTDATS